MAELTANQKILLKLKEQREKKELKQAQATDNVIDVVEKDSPASLGNAPAPAPIKMGTPLGTTPEYAKVYEDLCILEQQLNENIPGFATALRDIHRAMVQDVNIVTVMTNEEIGVVLAGLRRHMAVEVVAPKAKAKSATARLKHVSEDDI